MTTTDVFELLDRTASQVQVPVLDLAPLHARAGRRVRLRRAFQTLTAAAAVVAISLSASQLASGNGPKAGPVGSSPSATPVFDPYSRGLWPFTSAAQAQAWRDDPSAMPWAGDKAQVVQHFLTDVLHLQGVHADSLGCPKCFEQHIASDAKGGISADAALVGDTDGPFSVVNVTADPMPQLTPGNSGPAAPQGVTSPAQFSSVSSPLDVTGAAGDGMGLPYVELIASSGRALTPVTQAVGTDTHWTTTLTWSDQTWTNAGIVAITRDRVGTATSLVVLPVSRAGS